MRHPAPCRAEVAHPISVTDPDTVSDTDTATVTALDTDTATVPVKAPVTAPDTDTAPDTVTATVPDTVPATDTVPAPLRPAPARTGCPGAPGGFGPGYNTGRGRGRLRPGVRSICGAGPRHVTRRRRWHVQHR